MARRNSIYDAASVASDDLSEYDVISSGIRSLESSVDDLSHFGPGTRSHDITEPQPLLPAKERFATSTLTADDIQAYVRRMLDSAKGRSMSDVWDRRTVRVYVDGVFDVFHTGVALQLRQAKLSFPSVRLIVGVFPDEACDAHGSPPVLPQVERCELIRHCRWVDEVVSDVPWVLDEQFLLRHRVDYVALDEGTSVDPACDKVRLKGYDKLKESGRVIPTRRTFGLTSPPPPRAASAEPTGHLSVADDDADGPPGTPRSPQPADVCGRASA